MRYTFFTIFLLFSVAISAQVKLTEVDMNIRSIDEIGENFKVTNKARENLNPGDYVFSWKRKGHDISIYFTIIDGGLVNDWVVFKNGDNQTLVKCFIDKGVVKSYSRYNAETGIINRDNYLAGDTIIKRHYNKHSQTESEYKYLNDTVIYEYHCSVYSATDSIADCRINDFVNGISEYTFAGVLVERTITKGLDDGIESHSTYYDSSGSGNILYIEIKYTDDKTKTIYADGSYTIFDSEMIYKYDKTGKLMDSFPVIVPMAF